MNVIIDDLEYELLGEEAMTGNFRVKRDGKAYTFQREHLEQISRVFVTRIPNED